VVSGAPCQPGAMRIVELVRNAGDRMLGAMLPKGMALANRYICYDEVTGCGYGDGRCGVGHLGRWVRHCCIDDYTGVVAWCDPEQFLCGC
jgi:hypothetical protein